MKTSRCSIRQFVLIAGGWLLCLPAGYAAPGGAATVGSASTGTSGGAGHAVSAAPAAAGHSAGSAVGAMHSTAGIGGGLRSSGSAASGLRPGFGSGTGISRFPSGGLATAGLTPGQHSGTTQAGIARISPPASGIHNAWTDPGSVRSTGVYSAPSQQSGSVANSRAGNHLYPGTYGYVPTRPTNGQFQRGQYGGNRFRGHRHYYYNNFPYGVYYPYLYGNYGYGGGVTDYGALIADSTNNDIGAPDFSASPNNYYSYVAPDQGAPDAAAGPSNQPLPDAPAVGPQTPSAVDKSGNNSQGPDSLVEAVQTELSRRGYFEGQADSMYSAATREAIRRFQTDQHLPATGRINEATLHALHLD